MRRPLLTLPGFVLAGLVVMLLWAGESPAVPPGRDLAHLRAEAAAVHAEVERLDLVAASAVERYNAARVALDEVQARLIEHERGLSRTEQQLETARLTLGERVVGMYKSPQMSLLDVLLDAGDVADIETQLFYFQGMNDADAAAVDQLAALDEEARRLHEEIVRQRSLALATEMDLRDRQARVEEVLAARRALLDDLDAQVKRLVEREEQRRAAEARRLARLTGVDLAAIEGTAVQLAVLRETMRYLGIPYVWGGASPAHGFDCSGLVMYVYRKFGVRFLHGATVQARQGTPVPLAELQPADLVFFGDSRFYHHVGIYVGDGLFIEAPRTGDVVKVSRLAGRGCALACRYPIRMP